MKKNIAWIASLALNVVLATALAVTLISGGEFAPRPSDLAAGDGRKIEQSLRSAGLSAAESRALVAALVARREARALSYEYWRSAMARDAGAQIAELERDERVRAVLLKEFGTGAQEDPAFASVFRPYDRQFPMLSSQKQLQLQKHALEGLKSRLDASSPSALVPVSRTPSSEDAFEQVLDPKERFEYMVRESPLAKALTASPFDYTEKEFRDVFGVIAKARPESVMVSSTPALNEAMADEAVIEGLTKALGAERYEMLRRARDPSYSLLRRIADLRGISRETIDQAYTVLASAKPAATGADPAAVAAPPEALSALLGPAAAADVHRAFTYSRQAAAPGGPLSQASTRLPGRPLRVSPAAGPVR